MFFLFIFLSIPSAVTWLQLIVLLYPNSRLPIPQRPRAYTQFETYIFLIIVFVSSKLPAK